MTHRVMQGTIRQAVRLRCQELRISLFVPTEGSIRPGKWAEMGKGGWILVLAQGIEP